MITFVVLIFIGMVVKITVFPHLAVSVIWVTQNIAFGVESIKSIMETLKLTAQQAMNALKIPKGEQAKYMARL